MSGSQENTVGPVVIHRCYSDAEAEMVRSLLESYGIPCNLQSDITHVAYPFTVDGLGEVRILVPAPAADEARSILEAHRRTGSAGTAGEPLKEGEG
jgi:hypothetical protein